MIQKYTVTKHGSRQLDYGTRFSSSAFSLPQHFQNVTDALILQYPHVFIVVLEKCSVIEAFLCY